jgi:hypothetical protein
MKLTWNTNICLLKNSSVVCKIKFKLGYYFLGPALGSNLSLKMAGKEIQQSINEYKEVRHETEYLQVWLTMTLPTGLRSPSQVPCAISTYYTYIHILRIHMQSITSVFLMHDIKNSFPELGRTDVSN